MLQVENRFFHMPPVALTPAQIALLLDLCQVNSDLLNARLARSFGLPANIMGRVPDNQDLRIATELQLTHETMRALEAAR